MGWEEELRRHVLKLIQKFDPDATMDSIHLIGINFPEFDDLSSFAIPDLGKLYAFAIMREDYEQAKIVKEELLKRDCKINIDINEKTKEAILDLTFKPEKGVEHIDIHLKVLKDGLTIDWDKEDIE
jgi:hypothetical protein